jgi:hypothetical protein
MVGRTSNLLHLTTEARDVQTAIMHPRQTRPHQSSPTSTAWPEWALLVTASVNSM